MKIYNNISALKTSNRLNHINKAKTSNLEKLSSGMRVNKASDDASGLAISEKMRAQIRGMKQAVRNASDGQAMLLTAEGGLNEITSILQRMRELTVQGLNEVCTKEERKIINTELVELKDEIARISNTTSFNGNNLLTGYVPGVVGTTKEFSLHIGANSKDKMNISFIDIERVSSQINIPIRDLDTELANQTENTTQLTNIFGNMLDTLDEQTKLVLNSRSTIGAQINRLDCVINNLNTSIENITDAESRIRDLNMADEIVDFNRNNILSNTGTQMLSQANSMPLSILQLIQG